MSKSVESVPPSWLPWTSGMAVAPVRTRGFLLQEPENGTYPKLDYTFTDDVSRLLVFEPEACEVCGTITISALTMKEAPYGFKHHSSQQALLSSADKGCRLCLWVCYAMYLEPWIQGHADQSGTRAPAAWHHAFDPSQEQQASFPPILRYSKSVRGIRILNPVEATDRNILRVYTNHRSS